MSLNLRSSGFECSALRGIRPREIAVSGPVLPADTDTPPSLSFTYFLRVILLLRFHQQDGSLSIVSTDLPKCGTVSLMGAKTDGFPEICFPRSAPSLPKVVPRASKIMAPIPHMSVRRICLTKCCRPSSTPLQRATLMHL